MSGRQYLNQGVLISDAGPASEDVAKEPDAEGWTRCWQPRMLWGIHEAGHGIATLICGHRAYVMTYSKTDAPIKAFFKRGQKDPPKPEALLDESGPWETDKEMIDRYATILAWPLSVDEYKHRMHEAAKVLIRKYWKTVLRLADAMVVKGTLYEKDILEIVKAVGEIKIRTFEDVEATAQAQEPA
jgi:hypothetical protein